MSELHPRQVGSDVLEEQRSTVSLRSESVARKVKFEGCEQCELEQAAGLVSEERGRRAEGSVCMRIYQCIYADVVDRSTDRTHV